MELVEKIEKISITETTIVTDAFYMATRIAALKVLLAQVADPYEQLRVFQEFWKDLPKQGSQAWVDARPKSFGGSEIPTLLGETEKKHTVREVFESKLGINPFKGNNFTRWGNMFEDVTGFLLDYLFNMTSISTGSIPGLCNEKGEVAQTFSPDLIGVTHTDILLRVVEEIQGTGFAVYEEFRTFCQKMNKEIVALFEIKSPCLRIPSNEVPEHYLSQPKTGACTIPMVDICIFADALYFKCCIDDFGLDPAFDMDYHNYPTQRKVQDTPFVSGFIGVYDDSQPFAIGNSVAKPLPSTADMEKMANLLMKKIGEEVVAIGSDFYGLSFALKSLMSLVSLCDKLCDDLYQESGILDQCTWKEAQEVQMISLAIQRLVNPSEDEKKWIELLLPDAIRANYLARQRYNVEDLAFGIDYGGCPQKDFEALLEKLDDTRRFPDKKGVRLYYAPGYFHAEEMKEYFYGPNTPHREDNYIDWRLSEADRAQKWLYQNVQRFINHCRERNITVVGIIPWKLFRLSIIPIIKDPDFIEKNKDTILNYHRQLMDIQQKVAGLEGEARTAACIAELDKLFKPKRKNGNGKSNGNQRKTLSESGESDETKKSSPKKDHSQYINDFSDL